MKKTFTKIVALSLGAVASLSMAACTKPYEVDPSKKSNTCKIKAVKAGYEVDWLTAIAEKFNTTYADEGYKVEITLTDTTIDMMNEIKIPKTNDTDLYFEYNSVNKLVDASRSILGSKGGALLEDLTDLYNSKAVGLDKQEQGEKIIDRYDSSVLNSCKYTGVLPGYDGIYSMYYQGGSGGVYVNKKVLTDKGYTFDDLLTTASMLKVVAETAPANPLDTTAFFPVAWGGTVPGYWNQIAQVLFAQYEGRDAYHDFWNFIPKQGTQIENGYEVYQDRGMYESLRVVEALSNRDYTVPGTSSFTHTAAQARVFNGTSLLMVNGDWIYKEMEKDYGDKLGDVIAIKTPVISALGVKLNLCGATHAEGDTCASCEEKLKAIVKNVDLGKDKTAIASENGVSAEVAQTIIDARNYYLREIQEAFALSIPSYADAKDVAKLFIRFMFSDEMNDVYREHTYVSLFPNRTNEPDKSKMTETEISLYEKMHNENSQPIYQFRETPLRVRTDLNSFFVQGGDKYQYAALSYSHSKNPNEDKTRKMLDEGYEMLTTGWTEYVRQAGLSE